MIGYLYQIIKLQKQSLLGFDTSENVSIKDNQNKMPKKSCLFTYMKIFALRKFACPMGNEITPSYKKTSNVICNNKEDKSFCDHTVPQYTIYEGE